MLPKINMTTVTATGTAIAASRAAIRLTTPIQQYNNKNNYCKRKINSNIKDNSKQQ